MKPKFPHTVCHFFLSFFSTLLPCGSPGCMHPFRFTPAMAVGTPARQRTDGVIGTVDLGQVNLTTSHSVQSLGVIVDDPLSFIEQVNSVCNSANFHLRALRHCPSHLTLPRP